MLINGPEGRGPLSLQGLRIGLPYDAFIGPLDPEVRQAWEAALLVLKEEGAEVVKDVELPYPSFEMYRTIQRPEAAFSHMQKGWLSEKADLYTGRTREHLLAGQKIPPGDYFRASHERRLYSTTGRPGFQQAHWLFLPTEPLPAIP